MPEEMVIVKKKSESPWRWAILFLTCTMMIGNYYCYDIPAALNSQMDDYMGKPSDFATLFSLLYTVYSIPNIILPFFGGYFIDRLGVRVCMLVFAICITVGQLVFALGLSVKSWPIMFLGRVIYGFGGENLGVANSAILSVWFEGKELAFSFGLNLSIARLGSVINNLVSPAIANGINIQFAFWFGVILCGSSVLSVVLMSSIDKHLDSVMESKGTHALLVDQDEEEIKFGNNKGNDDNGSRSSSVSEAPQVQFRDMFSFGSIFWNLAIICVVVYGCVLPFNNIASALLLERDYFMDPPSGCHLLNDHLCQSASNYPVDCPSSKWYQPPLQYNVSFNDVDCTDSYWSDTCAVEFCNRQSDAQVQAGTIMSIPYIISAVLSPFLGGFVDKFGFRAVIATISPLALMVVHYFLGFTSVDPVGPLVGQGLAYSCFAAVVWPSVALVIDPRLVGLGYGIVVSIQNSGLAAFPLIIAAIYSDSNDHYIPKVEEFFIGLAILGCAIGVILNIIDYFYMDHVLNKPGKDEPDEPKDEKNFGDFNSMSNPIVNDEHEAQQSRSSRHSTGSRDGHHERQHSRTKSSELFATSLMH